MFDVDCRLPSSRTDSPEGMENASMDRLESLVLGVAAARHGAGPSRLASRIRTAGLSAFHEIVDGLSATSLAAVECEAEDLLSRGISVALLGSSAYPEQLRLVRGAPPHLFLYGASRLLAGSSIGICGSRAASDDGLRAAVACGEVAAQFGLTVVSGYARGVDTAAHLSTLRRGGSTIAVLPEGIANFRVKRGEFSEHWDLDRALVVSQFSPTQAWSAGAAMARNAVIFGLARALVVVEAGERGGTLAAGMRALDLHRTVMALEFAHVPLGNAMLVKRGAVPVRSRDELAARFGRLEEARGGQMTLL